MLNKTIKMLISHLHYENQELQKRLKTICEMWVDENITNEEFDEDYLILNNKLKINKKELEFLVEQSDKKTETEKEEEEEVEQIYNV